MIPLPRTQIAVGVAAVVFAACLAYLADQQWLSRPAFALMLTAACALLAAGTTTYLAWHLFRRRAPSAQSGHPAASIPDTDEHGWFLVLVAAPVAAVAILCGAMAAKELLAVCPDDDQCFAPTVPAAIQERAQSLASSWGLVVSLSPPKEVASDRAFRLRTGPAGATMDNGICAVRIDVEHVPKRFNGPRGFAQDEWLMAILVHEIAHCWDLRRDTDRLVQAEFYPGKWSAIGPERGPAVRTYQSWLEAARTSPAVLWREAFADTVLVGWLRMQGHQESVIKHLLQLRSAQSMAPTHKTCSAIDLASTELLPARAEELPAWADAIRQRLYLQEPKGPRCPA